MAFVTGLDTRNSKVLGNGAPVGIMEQQIFYLPSGTTVTQFDPYAQASTWIRIRGAELKSSEKTNTTPYYDQFDEVGVKQGRIESTFELSQDYMGLTENILKIKNQELWFAEGLQDDRVLKDENGNPIFQEINFYRAKLVDFTTDKGDVFKTTGSGKFNTATSFSVVKGVTPCNVTLDGNETGTTGAPYTLNFSATDLYGDAVDLSDLTAEALAGEVTAITVSDVTASAQDHIGSVTGTGSSRQVTFSKTGAVTVKVDVVTKNGGTFSATKVVTVS